MPVDTLWYKTLETLKTKMNRPAYEVFIKPIVPVSYSDSTLYLEIPNSLNMEYFEDHRKMIEETASSITGETVLIKAKRSEELHPVTAPKLEDAAPALTRSSQTPIPTVSTIVEEPQPEKKHKTFLNPRYVFDSFVVGSNNRLCYAASMAVAEAPGKAYNPLFIYGGVGLGKTHLMQAIGHYIADTRPNLIIKYITTDSFVNEVVSAIQENRLVEYRNSFLKTDLLLIDDIQFLQGKDRTQYEFIHIFNTLHEARKQIVITCDRLPKDIPTIEDRLVTRLNWGLITDIKSPDYETRLAILNKKLKSDGFEVPEGVLELVAEKVRTNIRDLEGTLTRIIAFTNFNNEEITLERVRDLINDIMPSEGSMGPLSISAIIKAVASHFGIQEEEILAKRRKKEIVRARQAAMFLCRELTDASLEKIGDAFNKDHTTVLYACDNIRDLVKNDPILETAIEAVRSKIKR